ncbi:MAG: cyclase/dehydrase [Leptolyngbya sp.]|nr:MAG: cyclase/dehydrase [Leptolyngbya sp.]
MLNCFQKKYLNFMGYTSAIALSLPVVLAAQALPKPSNFLARLPSQEQTTLKAGNVVLNGDNGRYTGRVLITAPVDTVWKVLTDYNHFKNFLPGVVSSRILETNGNQTVFEQVNSVRVLLFTQKSRLVVAASNQYPKQIDFRLKEGDIKSLNGMWKLEPVSPSQVLVTQEVTFDPGTSVPRGLAFNIYKNALADSLKAIKKETERRFTQR